MSNKILSIEELSKLQNSFVEATQTQEPVAIQTATSSVVNGDSTKIGSASPKDYTVTLWLPIIGKAPEGAEIVQDGHAYIQEISAKSKYITPRIARKVRNYASIISMAFTDFQENGDTDIYTPEDLFKVYEVFDDNVIDACEKLVGEVLGIPEHLTEYITDVSLMTNCAKILRENPSFFQID